MLRKLSNKESFDIKTCLYFLPPNRLPGRINPSDKVRFADLSSRGKKPDQQTPGFQNIQWGKTYRDEQITSWKRDIRDGLITKYEIYSSLPRWMQQWAEDKLRDVPYDVNGETSRMLRKCR